MSVPSSQFAAPMEAARQTYPFTLADLPFSYDALEPHFDQKTLQIHHRGHHATYVKKLNEAVAKHAHLHRIPLGELLQDLAKIPAEIRTAVKNNGGGHLNHDFFWSVLAPPGAKAPAGALAAAIDKDFGSFEDFRRRFGDVAAKHFASGWVALAWDHGARKLEIAELKDHEVLAPDRTGLLILDVWEHAYYVKYQNRRTEFIEAFWNVVNWPRAAEYFEHTGTR